MAARNSSWIGLSYTTFSYSDLPWLRNGFGDQPFA